MRSFRLNGTTGPKPWPLVRLALDGNRMVRRKDDAMDQGESASVRGQLHPILLPAFASQLPKR